MNDDKYTYPGSGGVLINRLGIRDATRLDEAMNFAASTAWADLDRQGPPEHPNMDYLASIHRRMFAPLLDWAGQVRDVDTGAVGAGITYARPAYIHDNLTELFSRLAETDYLRGLPRDEFADQLGAQWGTLSAIHPFRDGNTRSQSAYVSALAARAGYRIDWAAIDVDHLRQTRLAAVTGRDHGLRNYLRTHIRDNPATAPETTREEGTPPAATQQPTKGPLRTSGSAADRQELVRQQMLRAHRERLAGRSPKQRPTIGRRDDDPPRPPGPAQRGPRQ